MRNVVADKKTKGELGFDRPKKKNFNDLDGRNGCLEQQKELLNHPCRTL